MDEGGAGVRRSSFWFPSCLDPHYGCPGDDSVERSVQRRAERHSFLLASLLMGHFSTASKQGIALTTACSLAPKQMAVPYSANDTQSNVHSTVILIWNLFIQLYRTTKNLTESQLKAALSV
jgi:hypothetical protein